MARTRRRASTRPRKNGGCSSGPRASCASWARASGSRRSASLRERIETSCPSSPSIRGRRRLLSDKREGSCARRRCRVGRTHRSGRRIRETLRSGSCSSRRCPSRRPCSADLRQLEEVGGRLTVANNPSLVSLNALSALRNVGSLWVKECPLLTDLGGLEGITSVDELQLTDNDALLTFSGLENLTTAETVIVRRNPNLISLSGLSSLTRVRSTLSITENASLPDCEAEALATQVGKTCTPPDTYLTCTGICTCDGNNGSGTCP